LRCGTRTFSVLPVRSSAVLLRVFVDTSVKANFGEDGWNLCAQATSISESSSSACRAKPRQDQPITGNAGVARAERA
jgi:hypothetical protein